MLQIKTYGVIWEPATLGRECYVVDSHQEEGWCVVDLGKLVKCNPRSPERWMYSKTTPPGRCVVSSRHSGG